MDRRRRPRRDRRGGIGAVEVGAVEVGLFYNALQPAHIELPFPRSKLPLAERKSLMTIDETSRTDLYKKGLARIISDKKILAGEPVFRGTRLSVRHVGGMRLNGEPTERIIEDYPDLSAEDVEFAALYTALRLPPDRTKSRAQIAYSSIRER
jgi:uncharacterized protein (DUF433 family)